ATNAIFISQATPAGRPGSRALRFAPMAIVSEQVQEQLRLRFAERLQSPVELRLYTKPGSGRLILPSGLGCATCEEARRLAEAVRDAAPEKLTLEVVDVSQDAEAPVEGVPTLTV